MKKIIYILIVFFSFALFVIACEKDQITEDSVERLFRPVPFTAIVDGNEVTFSWAAIKNASYLIEISKDGGFNTDLQTFSIENKTIYVVSGLLSNTTYFARIKAISKDSSVNDSEYRETSFKTN